MSCEALLEQKVRYFEARGDRRQIDRWLSLGWHRLAEFNNLFPFLEHSDEIDKVTSGRLWNPGRPETSFLAWLVYQLRPLGGIGERLTEFFPGAANKCQDFANLLRASLTGDIPLADRLDCDWNRIRGFGGDRQIAKKVIASYYPDHCVPIFKTDHLERFVGDLGVDLQKECVARTSCAYTEELSAGKRWQLLSDLILDRKEHHAELRNRDNVYLMYVLYFSPPTPLRSLLNEPWSDSDSALVPLDEWIEKGESELVEFKATLRTNLHTSQTDKKMEESVVKTVAAFANSFGGTLLIGVSDAGEILGISRDVASLPHANLDGFRVHLRNLLSGSLGTDIAPYVSDSYEELQGKRVCVVTVRRRRKAATWCGTALYIRDGPSSKPLEGPDASKYEREHFDS